MSWVRYDDGFYSHPKVLRVIAEDPGAMALHVLANTWSSQQRRPGHVPMGIPGILVGDRRKGARWAALLERHGLWDVIEDGWNFHDHSDYRESASRSTPGTPAELSEKRRAAGSKGGKTTQQRKQRRDQTLQQTGQGVAANDQAADSPVVKASNEALTPEPVPTSSGALTLAPQQILETTASEIVGAYVRGATEAGRPRPSERLRGMVGKDAKRLLEKENTSGALLIEAAYRMGSAGFDSLDRELQRAVPVGANKATQRTQQGLSVIRNLQAESRGEIA